MKIRTKLFASHAIMALVLMAIAVGILFILRSGERNRYDLTDSYEQIRAVNLISTLSNDYSEQLAELFILGLDEADIAEVRRELFDALDDMEALLVEELGYISARSYVDEAELASERAKISRLNSMRLVVEGLESLRAEIVALLAAGRREEARAIYQDQIEHRLDSVLGELIDMAVDQERDEIAAATQASEMLSERLRMLAFFLVGTVTLLALANALMVHRALSRPITLLAAGAEAIGRGDLSHRVRIQQNDELGTLATRFNEMTDKIREQRDRLLAAKANLEDQVADRTRQLRARSHELEQAVHRLRELDENRARFFADISHELRTPLTVLRGHAEVTLRSCDSSPERLRQALAQVVRKSDEMGRLVEDLLFLARSEAGSIVVERKRLDLQEVFADVLLDSQSLSRRAGITISPRQPVDPVVIEGDADRLRQAIMIPLDNAVRLAPAETTISLSMSKRDGFATISVSDEGPGFTAEEAERAFVRFFHGAGGRGRTGRGTGLGLSIARWIVDQHDGRISIDSKPGESATIRIDLPLAGATS